MGGRRRYGFAFDEESTEEWENEGKAAVKLMLISCAGRNVIAVRHFKLSMSKGAILFGLLWLFKYAQGRITCKLKQ